MTPKRMTYDHRELVWHLWPAEVRLDLGTIQDIVDRYFAPVQEGDDALADAGVQVLDHQLVRYSVRMSIRHLLPVLTCVFLRLVLVREAGMSHADAAAMLNLVSAFIRYGIRNKTSTLEDTLVAWITMGDRNAPLPRALRPAASAAEAPAANAQPLLAAAAQANAQQ